MMKGNSQFSTVKSQLPKGWEIKKLGEVCENLDRQRIPIEKNKRVAGVVPYYGASGIVDYVEGYLFDEELLCVSEDGANLLARTYPIAFSIQGKTWVNNHAHVLRFANKSTQNFVKLYINFIKIDKYVSGMAQPKLNQKKLNSILIPLPPLAEQQRIVAKLDALFAKIQALETKTKQNLENAKELFKSYLQGVFENKGNNWEEKKLGEVCEYDKNKNTKFLPYVGLENIEANTGSFIGNLEPLSVKSSTFYFTEEHLLYGRLRPYLNKVLLPNFKGHCSTEIFPIKVNNKIKKEFLFYWFITSKTVGKINATWTGTRMPRADMNKVIEFSLPIPPLAEQQRIVEKLDSLSAETKRLESIYQEKLLSLSELKKSILNKAFKGEL